MLIIQVEYKYTSPREGAKIRLVLQDFLSPIVCANRVVYIPSRRPLSHIHALFD